MLCRALAAGLVVLLPGCGSEFTAGECENSALELDGVDDHVAVNHHAALQLRSFTLEMWIKPATVLGDREMRLLTHAQHSGSGYVLTTIPYGDPVGRLQARVYDGQQSGPAGEPPPTDRWSHVAATYDGAELVVYQDGWPTGGPTPGGLLPYDGELSIGANSGGSNFHWHGLIDEVRISDDVRYHDAFEPADRFEPDESTVALWHFDEGEGSFVQDATGVHRGRLEGDEQGGPSFVAGRCAAAD